jgi:hypothetical protein
LWESKIYTGGVLATAGSEENAQGSLDSMDPKDAEGFLQFREALVKKITQYEVISIFVHCILCIMH